MAIDKDNRLPLYCQLADILKEKIETSEWAENSKLPTERELCDMYDISRATVRQAMQDLETHGYIYKSQGLGTYVKPRKMKQDLLKFYDFSLEMRKRGKVPSYRLLDFSIHTCNKKIAEKLQIAPGTQVYKFSRLLMADSEPMIVQTTYLKHTLVPGFTQEKLEQHMKEGRSFFDLITRVYGLRLTSAEERFVPVLTRENEAELLGVLHQSPSMLIERTTFHHDIAVEYNVGIARGDKFEYRVVLEG